MENIQVLIVDYGSQYTLVIGRTLRELGVRSAILPEDKAERFLESYTPKAVILSGSHFSVHSDGAPQLPKNLDLSGTKYKVLGVCYGMQLLAHTLGGKVDRPQGHREYGPAKVDVDTSHPLFAGVSSTTDVWASHGDTVVELPNGFREIGRSGGCAAMCNESNTILGIQFHPEVVDTKEGKKILQNFLDIASCAKDWNPTDLIKEIQDEVIEVVRKKAGSNTSPQENVVLGVSGGVDSTTLAALLAPVLGDKLVCVAIDTGGVRSGEVEELKANVESAGVKNLIVLEASDEFIKNISTTIDAQEKRGKFRDVYKKLFEEQIAKHNAGFIVQGTLATDIIESGEAGKSALIKTHHNVGLDWEVDDLHPLRNLFKYEVRELGKALGLPEGVYNRSPFPGPGLYLRIVGEPVSKENLDLVREADKSVRDIVKKHGIEKDISQLIVAMLGIKSVGVKGDERVYGHAIAIRAVETVDFMTANGYYFKKAVMEEIIATLTKHKEIVRVFFDMTPKPPATTEFE